MGRNAQSHSPVEFRILRAIDLFCLQNKIDISPVYVMVERNLLADGLKRWTQYAIDDPPPREGMTHIDATAHLWDGVALSYNPNLGDAPLPNPFSIMWHVIRFSRHYNYRACEWRPGHCASGSLLGNWGVPVFSDQVLDIGAHELLARRVSHTLSVTGDVDIFLLAGYCATWEGIRYLRRTVAFRSVRYASMSVPFWLRAGAESAFWTSMASIDTALKGGQREASWAVYAAGGFRVTSLT